MIDGGYLKWHGEGGSYVLLDKAYLDGRYYTALNEQGSPFTAKPSDGVILVPTHGGTTVVQVPFLGDSAPLVGDRYDFTAGFAADDELDYLALKISKSKGRPVDYVPGLWAMETFPASSGVACTLSRRSADSILAPSAGISFAPRFFVSGEEDSGAGTVAGSIFTPATSGEISVYYMAVFEVVILGLSEDFSDVNDLVVTAQLSECVQASF